MIRPRPGPVDNPPPPFPASRQMPATCYRRKDCVSPVTEEPTMRIPLVGSRHFGVTTLDMLRQRGVDIVRVVVADAEDRLAVAARAAGIGSTVPANPKL